MNYAVIAAGYGSRLVSDGLRTPKPLVNLCGETMVDRLIRIFMANNAKSISIIVNEDMCDVYEYLLSIELPIPLYVMKKSTRSSMHSFATVTDTIGGGKFCLTTVDTVFNEEVFSQYIKAWQEDDSDGLMAVTEYIDDEKPLYVEVDANLNILSFKDDTYPTAKYVSGGIYCLDSKSIPLLHSCVSKGLHSMRNFQRALLTHGKKIKAYTFDKIVDVDHVKDVRIAEELIMTNFK